MMKRIETKKAHADATDNAQFQNKSTKKSLNSDSKFLIPKNTFKRLKSLNYSLAMCLPIKPNLRLKLARKLNVPSCLINSNIVHFKNVNNEQ